MVTSYGSSKVVLVNVVAGTISKAMPTQGRGSHMVGVTRAATRAHTGNMSVGETPDGVVYTRRGVSR